MTITIMTWNLKDYGADPDRERKRYKRIERVIAKTRPSIALVQELMTPRPAGGYWMSPDQKWQHRIALAPRLLSRLATKTAMAAPIIDGRPAAGIGGGDRHTAILFNPDTVEVELPTLRAYGPEAHVWHSIIAVAVRIRTEDGFRRLTVASAHLNPFSHEQQEIDAAQIARAVNLNYPGDQPPGIVGGDFNGLSAARRPDGEFYDPDPYQSVPWNPIFAHQLDKNGDVKRSTAQFLQDRCRMVDCEAEHGGEPQPSTGHFPGDPHPRRRIDLLFRTNDLPEEAVENVATLDTADAQAASDHLPKLLTLNPSALPAGGSHR